MHKEDVKRTICLVQLIAFWLTQVVSIPFASTLYAANPDAASVVVRVAEPIRMPPEKITDLIAAPNFALGDYPTGGGQVQLTWTAPKDLPGNQPVFSYIIKYATFSPSSLGEGDAGTTTWWNHQFTQTVFSNHFWWLPEQARGQTFEHLPFAFGLPAPGSPEKYNLGYGFTEQLVVTGLVKGETYFLGVAARDRFYNLSTAAVSETFAPGAITPPGAITDLVFNEGLRALTWTSPGNDGYNYKIPDGKFLICYSSHVYGERIDEFTPDNVESLWPYVRKIAISTRTAPGEQNIYTITGLVFDSDDVNYYFLVWTSDEWNGKNNWSERSNGARARITFPDYVTEINLSHDASPEVSTGSYVNLSWRNPEGITITEVRIYYSTYSTPGMPDTFVEVDATGQGMVYNFIHKQLMPRKNYYYTIKARNAAGEMPGRTAGNSAMISVDKDLIAPDSVANLTGLAGAVPDAYCYVNLNWTLPVSTAYQNWDFERIEIIRSTDNANWTDVASISPQTTYYRINYLEPYTTHYFKVFSTDGGNNKSTATVSVYIPFGFWRPGKLKIAEFFVRASTSADIGSYVTFIATNPVIAEIQNPLERVLVYYSTAPGGKDNQWTNTQHLGSQETYSFDLIRLLPRSTYYFTFVVYDIAGMSSLEVTHSTFTYADVLSPDAVTGLTATPGANQTDGSFVRLNWTNPDPTVYRNYDFDGLLVRAGTTSVAGPFDREATLPRSSTSYVFTKLEPHTTYFFVVNALDSHIPANYSTATVSAFTLYDVIPPSPATVTISSSTWSDDIETGCVIAITLNTPTDTDLDRAVVIYREGKAPSNLLDGTTVFDELISPNGQYTAKATGLVGNTTYFISVLVFDESGNVSTATVSGTVSVPKGDTTPLFAQTGFDTSKDHENFTISWSPVSLQFVGGDRKNIKGLSTQLKASEIYRYQVYESDDMKEWQPASKLYKPTEKLQFTSKLKASKKFYLVRAFNIGGNYSDSMVADDSDDLNVYYLLSEDNSYLKFNKDVRQDITKGDVYLFVERDTSQEFGSVAKSYEIEAFKVKTDGETKEVNPLSIFKFNSGAAEIAIKYKDGVGKAQKQAAQRFLTMNVDENSYSIFYFNGVVWQRLGTTTDKDEGLVKANIRFAGKYQLRRTPPATEWTFYGVVPKIITPTGSKGENDKAFFEFANPKGAKVSIKIFNVNSALVRDLGETTVESSIAGQGNSIYWDGKNDAGKFVQPGVYVYQLEVEGNVINGTIVVAR